MVRLASSPGAFPSGREIQCQSQPRGTGIKACDDDATRNYLDGTASHIGALDLPFRRQKLRLCALVRPDLTECLHAYPNLSILHVSGPDEFPPNMWMIPSDDRNTGIDNSLYI
jgi:hypothetical protein